MSEKVYRYINVKLMKRDLKQIIPVGVALLVLFAFMYLIFQTNCITRFITGFPCPGCGLTRAGICVLTLQWKKALYYNGFIFPIILLTLMALYYRYVKGTDMPHVGKMIITLIIFMVIYYIYRMIRYYPNRAPLDYSSNNLIVVTIQQLTDFLEIIK